jgi:hypothetical protein
VERDHGGKVTRVQKMLAEERRWRAKRMVYRAGYVVDAAFVIILAVEVAFGLYPVPTLLMWIALSAAVIRAAMQEQGL